MTELLLIRHGATAGNLEKRYIGRTDEPLCKTGIEQVRRLRERGLAAGLLFASPMLRARQTAELLFPGWAYTVLDGLRETDFGEFEGHSAMELSGSAVYRAWVDGGCAGTIPGGENVAAFKERVCAAFAAAMETVPDGERATFVLHGGGIMAILERYARPRRGFYEYHIGNGHAISCRWDQGVIDAGIKPAEFEEGRR